MRNYWRVGTAGRLAHLERSGAAAASQSDVSRWENGAIGLPQCVPSLLAYCDAYGPDAAMPLSESRTEPVGHGATRSTAVPESRAASFGDDADSFEMLAADAAGEPLLGAAQRELVRGMSRRLEHGLPLTPEDRATYLDQLRILRVPGGAGGGSG
jgi:hypothetical protein